jgi:hypothetical protein
MSVSDKSVELPKFSAKREEFHVWWIKFQAFSAAKGLYNVIQESSANLPATQEEVKEMSDEKQREKEKMRTLNGILIVYLTSACKRQSDLIIVLETMTDNKPGGIAFKLFDRLKKKYQPKDGITDVAVQERLTAISMKKDDNPDVLFDQLSIIKNWYNTPSKKHPES